MITIIARKHIRYDAEGRDVARIFIAVASASELPASQTAIDNINFTEASRAWDVSTGDKYGYVVGQGWKKQATVINPMTLKGRVDTMEDLEAIQNPEVGWVYFVGSEGESDLPEYMYTEDGYWDPIGTSSVTIEVDSALSTTSENPVQNKVITGAIDGLVSYDSTNAKLKKTLGGVTSDVMTVDTTPTANSKNPVTSGAVTTALATKADLSIFNPMSESAYEALTTYTNPLYFIYEDAS